MGDHLMPKIGDYNKGCCSSADAWAEGVPPWGAAPALGRHRTSAEGTQTPRTGHHLQQPTCCPPMVQRRYINLFGTSLSSNLGIKHIPGLG